MKIAMPLICLLLVVTSQLSWADRGGYRHFDDHRGYRDRPYDHHRKYNYHKHRDHRYHYQGHWRSWDDFDHYARKHPHLRERGRYYYDGVHLMFRTCPSDTDTCLFFSIGR